MEGKFNPERLRPPEHVSEPDPRSSALVRIDRASGTYRPIALADHHEQIAEFVLHQNVPQEIVEQFETARNLYLYAWFVYRFYSVAQHHVLACLELALRDRLKEDIQTGKIKSKEKTLKRPTLAPLLKYAVAQGLVKNEGFDTWRRRGEINARARTEMEKLREASEKGLTEVTWSEADIQVTEEDLNWDYKNVLAETLPFLRNDYAHGSTNLYPAPVSHTIQIVCEIINQLYEQPA